MSVGLPCRHKHTTKPFELFNPIATPLPCHHPPTYSSTIHHISRDYKRHETKLLGRSWAAVVKEELQTEQNDDDYMRPVFHSEYIIIFSHPLPITSTTSKKLHRFGCLIWFFNSLKEEEKAEREELPFIILLNTVAHTYLHISDYDTNNQKGGWRTGGGKILVKKLTV